jgi:hypothetical protein
LATLIFAMISPCALNGNRTCRAAGILVRPIARLGFRGKRGL